jgi:hypothetical protein
MEIIESVDLRTKAGFKIEFFVIFIAPPPPRISQQRKNKDRLALMTGRLLYHISNVKCFLYFFEGNLASD